MRHNDHQQGAGWVAALGRRARGGRGGGRGREGGWRTVVQDDVVGVRGLELVGVTLFQRVVDLLAGGQQALLNLVGARHDILHGTCADVSP